MPLTCPNGHLSGADDYCDTCGSPMRTVTPPPAEPVPAAPVHAEPAAEVCPHCSTANPAGALFCEGCGYDFTTGVLPGPVPLADGTFLAPPPPPPAPPEPPAEVAVAASTPEPAPTPAPGRAPGRTPAAPSTSPAGAFAQPSREGVRAWVVEVWIDPEWFAVQDSDQDCPSPAVPDVIPLHGSSALVGRPSASRGVHPEVDCGADGSVSRRQAQLTCDGRRWWIEDLGSANGTFVGPAQGPLPEEPLPPGRRVELDIDDRVYVGAWTRLVIRPATASERAGTG